jgi:hypothetical protein
MGKDYWKDNCGAQGKDFVAGVIAGITAFAWWKDGTQYVGTCGKTLKEAIAEAKEGLGYTGEELK